MPTLAYADVKTATDRIGGHIRPVTVTPADPGGEPYELHLALELLQHTGSFKARGAQNFLLAHREEGTLPAAGITIASGGNAGLACAWSARRQGVTATVFLPATAPQVKVDRLRGYGADVRLVGTEYAEALAACEAFAADTGALASHAYDHPLIAAGAAPSSTRSTSGSRTWTPSSSRSAAVGCSPASPPPPGTTASVPSPSNPRTAAPSTPPSGPDTPST